MNQREANYYRAVRDANRQAWNAINDLVALQREYNALDYGNDLPDLEDEADNVITRQMVGSVVFDTANAFVTLLGTGHATNMAKLL